MKKVLKAGVATREELEASRTVEALLAHFDPVENAPKFAGLIDLYSGNVYAIAVKCIGQIWYHRMLMRLAAKGHSAAIRDLVVHACEMVELIEEIATTSPDFLRELARRRADWPVKLCRHETSNKLISTYLDSICLGANCLINADGKQVAKYSLRTPINRFVWRKLKGLPFSIRLMSDVPAIAAIRLEALPKLSKSTAKVWADQALMPYITAMYEDFSQVTEFRTILSRPGVKTRGQQRREIRKDVIRALQSLAPFS